MICYLDMDGVLCNWSEPVAKALGLPYPPDTYRFFGDGEKAHEIADEMSNKELTANLKWMPDGKQILELVKEYFDEEDVYLLTKPRPNPDMWSGRKVWVERNIPTFIDRLIMLTASKSLLANTDSILIDDYDMNVEQFMRAGGYGVLVPRPWNLFREYDTVSHIAGQLEIINNVAG